MTRSGSTPRLRLTTAYYVALVILTAVVGRPPLAPALDLAVGLVALALVTFAALGRIWCSVFIAGRKDTELVTSGPYALCRHPLYALSLVGGLGLGIATRSITLAVVTLVVLVVMVSLAANVEERVLAEHHGSKFSDYAALVPRWWPRLRNWHMPTEMRVHPDILWKAFVDAGSFLLLYALIVAAHAARTAGITPTLIVLP